MNGLVPLPASPDAVLIARLEEHARAARGAHGIVHTASTYTDSAVDIAAMEALLSAWETGPFVFVSSLDVYGVVATAAFGAALTAVGAILSDFLLVYLDPRIRLS